jgi:hypothetical protein
MSFRAPVEPASERRSVAAFGNRRYRRRADAGDEPARIGVGRANPVPDRAADARCEGVEYASWSPSERGIMAIAVDMTYTVSGMDTYHKASTHMGSRVEPTNDPRSVSVAIVTSADSSTWAATQS